MNQNYIKSSLIGQTYLATKAARKQAATQKMLRSIFFGIVFILSCALVPTAVKGQVVLDNKAASVADNNKAGYDGNFGRAVKAAQAFTTGTTLTCQSISVDLVMTTAEGTPAANFTVQICGATGDLPDEGNILATLSGNSNPAGAGTYTYTGTVTWAAGQNLFIVCSANTTTGAYLWVTTDANTITTSNAYTAPFRLHTTASSWGYADDFRHLFSLTVSTAPSCTAPTAYNLTGGGAYCAGGTGVEVGLAYSETGVTYQLKKDNVDDGTAVAGTGSAISFGNKTAAGTYTVVATTATGCCNANMNGNATVTITPLPVAYNVTGGGAYCAGGTGVAVGLSNSETGVSYQLKKDGSPVGNPVAGTGNAISFGNQTAAGVYTVEAIKTLPSPVRIGVTTGALAPPPSGGSCTVTMTGSVTITITPLPTAYNVTGGGSYCAGGTGVAVGLSNSETGVSYQLKKDGSPVGNPVAGTGNAISFGNQTAAGTYTVEAIKNPPIPVRIAATNGALAPSPSGGSCNVTMTGSAIITVNPLPTAILAGGATLCQNTASPNITFTGSAGKAPYTFTYSVNGGGNQTVSTSDGNSVTVAVPTNNAGTFTYTLLSVSDANSCGQAQSGTAVVTVNPIHVLTLTSAAKSVGGCINAPISPITFALSGGAMGATVSGLPTGMTASVNNGVLTISGTPSVSGVFNYSITTTGNECATASASGTITLNTKPTFTLSVNGQSFNEGNNPTLCDTDANPVNGLQLTVNNSCVAGPVLWRTQAGAGAWSDWSATAPSSQPSNNIAYKYQAACDAACPSTLSNIITLTLNYRAATPQNVSLVADGTNVNAGETKTICNLEGNTLTFNATCASGEILLYSVDGGEYSALVPSQIVDGNFHNYRVRCRKADGIPSCVETESGVMSLKITTNAAAPTVSITPTSNCGTPTAFAGSSSCGTLVTVWYNAATNQALPTLPTTTPNATTSYYARCQAEGGCLSEKSNVVTFTITPVNEAPLVTVSAELVCAGTEVTVSTNCPAGTSVLWNTGVSEASFKVAFSNVTKATYWAKCIAPNGCQSSESNRKTVSWKGFELTFINVGQSQSATKSNDKAAWASQFITPDAGPELDYSTEANPTIYFSENVNKTAPRFWTIHAETCNLGTDGSLTFNLLATPELGVIRSYNTHENNAPYFMYANRAGFTELYAQNHPAYGFFADNGNGGNVYDEGLPKGLYKLGVRYWDQKGQGSIYPSTRQPAGSVLAYQEYWFRIQSKNGVGTGAARTAADNGQRTTENGFFAQVMPNPVSNTLHLKVSEAKGQKVNVSLVDASGRALLQRSFVPETNQHQEEFEVSQLSNGMYFLKVNTAEKQTTLKVVKVQ